MGTSNGFLRSAGGAVPLRPGRRTYAGLRQLWRDVRRLLLRWSGLRGLRHATRLPATFRERLMLTVTAVNRCRYCAGLHGRLAEQAGIAAEEIDALLTGTLDPAPAAKRAALRYASQWAAADGRSDPVARAELTRLYGGRTAEAIDSAVLMIRLGNLLGNSLDRWVRRVLPWRSGADTPGPPSANESPG